MKTYRVIISDAAIEGVREYLHYIAVEQQAPLNAQRWWDKALARVLSLDRMPHRCPLAPENEFEALTIRMLIVDRCLFLYTVDDDDRFVRVLKFRHGSQLPGPLC